MKTIQERLRDADPVRHEPGLSSTDIDQIRRAMLNTPRRRAFPKWSGSLILASALAVMIAIVLDRRAPSKLAAGLESTNDEVRDTGTRRQLQFATPGGTRVIWVFDPRFDVK